MALDTYANLQTAILSWLARPGDTLISGGVPDMITLFEAEARRRLKTRWNEATATLNLSANVETVALPADFYELREARITGVDPMAELVYMTGPELDVAYPSTTADQPVNFTIEGLNARFRPVPDTAYTVTIDYMQGLTGLSNSVTTNWLLTNHPDAYLFGSLAEAVAYIGDDERIALWLQRREAAFESILLADRKARWGGGPLIIKTDTGNP